MPATKSAPKSNLPKEPLRWSLEDALREFGHEVRTYDTLRKNLRVAEAFPAPDGTYSTEQLTEAIYGSAARQRVRESKERADNWALKNGILRGELLPRALLTQAMEAVFIIAAQVIKASSMSTQEKRDALTNLATWPVVVKNVATKASKQVQTSAKENGSNGDDEED